MRASLSLFIISLLISQTFCTKSQDVSFLESLKKSEFGKTILESVQLELRTGSKDAVDNVLTLLNKLRDDETAAQADADSSWATESQQCNDTATSLQEEIDNAKSEKEDNLEQIDILNANIQQNQSALADAEDSLKTYQDNLAALTSNRNDAHALFLQQTADISAAITALSEGKTIMETLEVQPSSDASGFIQKRQPNAFIQFASSFQNKNIKGKFKGFIDMLVAIASKQVGIVADQDLVDKIVKIIEDLIDQLSNQLATLASNEKTAQDSYEAQSTDLNAQISSVNANIANLQTSISALGNEVADLVNENQSLDDTVEDKEQQLSDSESHCNDDENAYDDASQIRANELDIINQVITIFQTRFDNVRSYLTGTIF